MSFRNNVIIGGLTTIFDHYYHTEQCIYIFRGNTLGWRSTCTQLPVWGLYGNADNDANAFLGTTDNQPIILRATTFKEVY